MAGSWLYSFDIGIPEMFAHRAHLFDGRCPHAVKSDSLRQGGFAEISRPSGGSPDEDRGSESDLLGLLHDGQGIRVIPDPDKDIRFGFFSVPEHGAIVSAALGRAFEGFSLNRNLFSRSRFPLFIQSLSGFERSGAERPFLVGHKPFPDFDLGTLFVDRRPAFDITLPLFVIPGVEVEVPIGGQHRRPVHSGRRRRPSIPSPFRIFS